MADKNVVKWQNSYSIGIKLIDGQHKQLIDLTNKLFASCLVSQDRAEKIFLNTIHEAVDYVGYHFGTEEKVMERVNYPEFRAHKQLHNEFIREVFTKVEEFKSGKVFTPIAFVYYLRDWVLHHIAVTDKKMGEYLLKLRKSGELQKMTVQIKKDKTTDRIQIR